MLSHPIKVLLIEDNPDHTSMIMAMLDPKWTINIELESTDTLASGLKLLNEKYYDAIILDLWLPDSQGLNTFVRVYSNSPNKPIILLTSIEDEEIVVKAAKEGAQDYLVKGEVNSHLLIRSIHYAIERKNTEVKLKHTAAELERSNAELEQFASIASHDLQEPLHLVISYLKLLQQRYGEQLDGTAQDFINCTIDISNRMQDLISDLLAYSRVGTKGKPFEPTDFNVIVENTLKSSAASIESNNVKINQAELPVVNGDPSQLFQLMQNLIGNAIKFKREDPVVIDISAEIKGDMWLFAIKDNGIGIDPKFYDTIFQIFTRLHGQSEYTGTGVGLAICKRVVERCGGSIWVDSKPGVGSTFYFTLPVDREADIAKIPLK